MPDTDTYSEPIDQEEEEQEPAPESNFWADHLLQYNPSFNMGHPYLQGQWAQYQADQRNHIIKTIAVVILLIGIGLASTRIPYYWMMYIGPALCLGYGIFSVRRWKRKNAQLEHRAKELKAASEVIRNRTTDIVQYSVEEIGQHKHQVLKNCVPNCRVVIEGAKSVPKYCGSWPIRNWKTLGESDRVGLHSEYRSYVTGKVWHGVDHSVALLTDCGTVLWFV